MTYKAGDQAVYFDPTVPEGYPGADVWQHQVVTIVYDPDMEEPLSLARLLTGGDVVNVVAPNGDPGFAPVKFLEPVSV